MYSYTMNNHKKWFLIALVLHLLAAIFTMGFFHFDEHFQILEFANYKLGNISAGELPWEFRERMRPFLQSFLFYGVAKAWMFVGVKSPFFFAFFFRLISALLGFFSFVWFYRGLVKVYDRDYLKKLLPAALALLWFIPFLHARPSSENWSIIFFMFALALILLKREEIKSGKKHLRYLAGIGSLLGASFLFRYQIGFMAIGLFFWAIVVERIAIRSLLFSLIFVGIAVGAGVLVDYWGYGELTFAPWNYFYKNLVDGRAAKFGVMPWWGYLKLILKRGYPPIGILLMISYLFLWVKYPKNLLTWVTVPFVLIHCMVGHKELRFLFPVATLAPFVFVFMMEWVNKKITGRRALKKVYSVFKYLVLSVNFILLLGATFKPAKTCIGFYKYLYSDRGELISNLHVFGENPFTMLGLPLRFYVNKMPKLHLHNRTSLGENASLDGVDWLFVDKAKYFLLMRSKFPQCKMIYSNYPQLFLENNIGNWQKRSRGWMLFDCRDSGKEYL